MHRNNGHAQRCLHTFSVLRGTADEIICAHARLMTTGPASLYFVTCSTARGALDAENNKPMKTPSLKAHLATDQVNNSVIVTNNGIIYKG